MTDSISESVPKIPTRITSNHAKLLAMVADGWSVYDAEDLKGLGEIQSLLQSLLNKDRDIYDPKTEVVISKEVWATIQQEASVARMYSKIVGLDSASLGKQEENR